MSRPTGRTSACDAAAARTRLRHADSFAVVAQLVLDQPDDESLSLPSVVAALAVLAGIAATDAACCARLGERARGRDHRHAVDLVRNLEPHGRRMATDLDRLLVTKDEAHYGTLGVSHADAASAAARARRMVTAARDLVG